MSEIRKNIITGEYVIIAPERAGRPHDIADTVSQAAPSEHEPNCPFCQGNEDKTPQETYRYPESGAWLVRSFPNKFSALQTSGALWKKSDGLKITAAGVGPHEVIVETPRHDLTLATMTDEEVKCVVRASHNRFIGLYSDPRVEHVILFKNHGVSAGTSLAHPHSQIVGLPMTPVQFRRRSEDAFRFFEEQGECVICKTLGDEASDGGRVVHETESFLAFIPFAALSPFHIWIFPKRHCAFFGDAKGEELNDLAVMLKAVLYKVYKGLSNPDFNVDLLSAPPSESSSHYLHWYISIVPRVTTRAGFELGTGMFINPSLPDTSAAMLREVA